ncbi:MAG: M60 family metallopeptidase, partial [Planctomycetota bacterium]
MNAKIKLSLLVSLGVIVAFSSTGLATLGDLSDAMSDLTDHINGTTPLTGPQLEARTATIEANKSFMDDNTAIMTEAFDLSNLYETVVGPLFINAETSGGFPREQGGSDGYELERAIFLVQQTIIDVIYTPANCQTYQAFLDGRKFETADFFPGACAPPGDPQVSYNVNINGSNATMWGKPVCYGPIPARRPTGVYLAPGSIGEVTVPPAIVNQGFEILVGAHTVDKYAYYKGTLLRLDRVTKSFPITSTVTKIANPLGGGVYIMVPYEVYFGTQTVSIKNVVQAPYFAATSTNQTTLQQWTDTERHHPGPWADFESEKFMMTLPTSWIYNYADPVTQMQDWDIAMDAVSEMLGWIPPYNIRNLPVLYVMPDRSIQHGAYGTGYPQINTIYNPDSPTNGNQNHFFLRDVLGWSTTYHELGHCQLFSKFPGHTEATVNLPFVYVAEQKFGWDQTTALTESMKLAYLENMSVDQTALTWFVTKNFRNGNPMDITNSTKNEVRYQHRGYGRYVD